MSTVKQTQVGEDLAHLTPKEHPWADSGRHKQVRAPALDLAQFMFNNCNYKALLAPSHLFLRKIPSSCMSGDSLVSEDVVR